MYISWKEPNKYCFSLNPVENENGTIKLWTREESPKKLINNKTYYKVTTLMLEEYDCNKRKFKKDQVVYYDSKMKVLDNINFENGTINNTWLNVVPASLGEKLFTSICSVHYPVIRRRQ